MITRLVDSGLIPVGVQTALPALTASATPFASIDSTTMAIELTVRGAGITLTRDGATTPTAGAVGIDYAPGTYWLDEFNYDELKAIKMIQNGGVATGSFQCYKRK